MLGSLLFCFLLCTMKRRRRKRPSRTSTMMPVMAPIWYVSIWMAALVKLLRLPTTTTTPAVEGEGRGGNCV